MRVLEAPDLWRLVFPVSRTINATLTAASGYIISVIRVCST